MPEQTLSNPEKAAELGARIQRLLDVKRVSVRELQRRVARSTDNARGSSHGSIRDLVAGKTYRPAPHIVTAIAGSLDVRTEYLTKLQGPVSDLGDYLVEAGYGPDEIEESEWDNLTYIALRKAIHELPFKRQDLIFGLEEIFTNLARTILCTDGRVLRSYTADEIAEVIKPLGWAWMFIGEIFHQDENWDPRDFQQYFMSIAQAIWAAMPDPGSGDPEKTIARLEELRKRFSGPPELNMTDVALWADLPSENEGYPSAPTPDELGEQFTCPDCGLKVANPWSPQPEP